MTADLLALQAQQIKKWDYDIKEALLQVQWHRDVNQDRFNNWEQLQKISIKEHSLVLLHNIKQETSYSDKLGFYWLGPYCVWIIYSNRVYLLEELDRTVFRISVYGNQLKSFFSLLDLVSLNTEFLDELVDEFMDLSGRDDEKRLDEETPKKDLFDKNQDQEEVNKLSTPLTED